MPSSQSRVDLVGRAGHDDRDEVRPSTRAIRVRWAPSVAEQAHGVLDDPAEDLVRVVQRGDPGGDVAQRALGLGAAARGPSATARSSSMSRALVMAMAACSASAAEDRGVEGVERVRRRG